MRWDKQTQGRGGFRSEYGREPRVYILSPIRLGKLNRREIASLAGLAPINSDSGQFRGVRMICGGRSKVRKALYMATLVATVYNPTIRNFYNRLLASGKPKKLALTACMRKLLIILNSISKNDPIICTLS